MSSYSQFINSASAYTAVNRLVDHVELHRIIVARDGAIFDEHFADILDNACDPDFGVEAKPISRIEERRGTTRAGVKYRASPSHQFPESFLLLQQMATHGDPDRFVRALTAPAAYQFPLERRYGVVFVAPPLAASQEYFAQHHGLDLGRIIAPALLAELSSQVKGARFAAMDHKGLGPDYTMDLGVTQAMLHYLVTDARIMRFLEELSGLPRRSLRRFSGRVYRMIPQRDEDVYHNDVHLTDLRLMAISLVLEPEPCAEGGLLMRRKGWRRAFANMPVPPQGHAAMFRISRELQHKVDRVTHGARTNLAGWYCPGVSFDYDGWVDRPLFAPENMWSPRTLLRRMTATA